jgi:3',5'-cyclic AMP phosphodiesterase CpdA
MTTFNAARRDYDPNLDVREKYHDDLAQRMKNDKPHGPFWLLLAARRMGKTWTLEGVRHCLAGATGTYLDLRSEGGVLDGEPPSMYLLLDEPGRQLQSTDSAAVFINRCVELRRQGKKILLALNPAEWSLLKQADQTSKRVDYRDELPPLTQLTDDQVTHLAGRQPWAKTLVRQYGTENPWRRTPFLLEHLLEVAERTPMLRKDLPKLQEEAIIQAGGPTRVYVEALYHRGLSEAQRETVRAVARRREADREACELLCRGGVLDKQGKHYVLADPILADHLPPPLRIHHISDIHVGPKAAAATDVKLTDVIGKVLGDATGAGPVRGTYLHHVQALAGNGTRPHLIVVSGDIAEWATVEQYREFAEWFKRLRGLLAPHPHLGDEPRVLFVGGNHDVDWNQALGTAGARERHKPFAEAFKDFPHPHLEKAPDERKAEDAVVEYPRLRVAFLLLGSAEFGGEVMPGNDPEQRELLNRIEALRADLLTAAKKDDAKEKEVDALLKRLARVDPGLVHKQDLVRAQGYGWDDQMPIRIAVLHHPVSPLPVTEINHFVGLLNAGEVKQALFEKQFCLVLHGHLHMGWLACEQWPEQYGDWALRIAAAPTLGSREKDETRNPP